MEEPAESNVNETDARAEWYNWSCIQARRLTKVPAVSNNYITFKPILKGWVEELHADRTNNTFTTMKAEGEGWDPVKLA